ncbi:uncharacterized protein METZ01_LOCUS362482 [marine metagenome]|uniref:Uncharacterized protein n=1 Tax=marine metagenome TaxID=408172 RepID=A0A382SKA5_9ZZZZ
MNSLEKMLLFLNIPIQVYVAFLERLLMKQEKLSVFFLVGKSKW